MKKLLILPMLLLLTGCISQAAKNEVRDTHALTYVMVKRINDPDPAKRPTQAELEQTVKTFASMAESLDREVNNWQPTGAMKAVDINGRPLDLNTGAPVGAPVTPTPPPTTKEWQPYE